MDVKLRTGGALTGPVIDHTDHGLVILQGHTPYVFGWNELEPGCAYATRRALLVFDRGSESALRAEDHQQLGLFALWLGRNDLAANEFRRAIRLRPGLEPGIDKATGDYRRRQQSMHREALFPEDFHVNGARDGHQEHDRLGDSLAPPPHDREATIVATLSPTDRAAVREVYMRFGAKVEEVMGRGVTLIESDHFLIWTDWRKRYHDRLAGWCESMYTTLCEQFNLNATGDIFLAKCPVFCWRSKARFQRFARYFDGFEGEGSIGYTRSIEKNGHVHIVLLRQGHSKADFDRFACTLVHEGTHAFLHRLYTPRLIPHWINEGYADLMAERVLGDLCPAGENAELLARQFVRHHWPITGLLHSIGPIEVQQYPIAHSVMAYLQSLGRQRLAGFIKDLKEGHSVADALAFHYDDMTLAQLEAAWRSAVREKR